MVGEDGLRPSGGGGATSGTRTAHREGLLVVVGWGNVVPEVQGQF